MSIIKHVTLQKIVAHDFRYDPRITKYATEVTLLDSQHKDTQKERSAISGVFLK